jgi:hypothetical protein
VAAQSRFSERASAAPGATEDGPKLVLTAVQSALLSVIAAFGDGDGCDGRINQNVLLLAATVTAGLSLIGARVSSTVDR